jgi:hypothetical protein
MNRRSILSLSAITATKCNFLVLFPRNVEPHRAGFGNRRDIREFLTGLLL